MGSTDEDESTTITARQLVAKMTQKDRNMLLETVGKLLSKEKKNRKKKKKSVQKFQRPPRESNNNYEVIDLDSDSDSKSDTKRSSGATVTDENFSEESESSVVEITSDDEESTSEKSIDERQNAKNAAPRNEGGNGDDVVEDDEEPDVVILSDDEEKNSKAAQAVASRISFVCTRCPKNSRRGIFRTRKSFILHVKRHGLGEVFNCLTCNKTFTAINLCFAHEIIEHGTEIEYEKNDPVISNAKHFAMKTKKEQIGINKNSKGHLETICQPNNDTQRNSNKTDKEDCSDDFCFNDESTSSTPIHLYRGLPTNHILECYEIQLYRSKYKDYANKTLAAIALAIHDENVQLKNDAFRLGRFSSSRLKSSGKANPKQSDIGAKRRQNSDSSNSNDDCTESEPSVKRIKLVENDTDSLTSNKSSSSGNHATSFVLNNHSSSSSQIVLPTNASTSEKMSSLHDTDNSSDSDYDPRMSKTKNKTLENFGWGKKKTGNRAVKKTSPMKALNPTLTRTCNKCNYKWVTQADLIEHRDQKHPSMLLIDLLSVPNPETATDSLAPEGSSSSSTDTNTSTGKKRKRKYALVENEILQSAIQNTKRSKTRNKTIAKAKRRTFPIPNSFYTEKETFLHSLGLYNNVRLQLQLATSPEKIKLTKTCSVRIERMSDLDLDYYINKNCQYPASQMGFHFLLGYGGAAGL